MFFFFQSTPYIAIIGDIVNSKEISNRDASQKKLQSILDMINQEYERDIASNFMITLGDEFQGLLRCGENTMNIITQIEIKMYPVSIRFGIGIGEIITDINRNIPLGADGPAYHYARDMVENLKNNRKKSKRVESNIMLRSDAQNTSIDLLLNSILSLCSTIKLKWTNRQREIIFDCIEYGANQKETAKRLGITQSSVQKSLAASGYYSYKNAIDTVSKTLCKIGE